MTTKPKLTYFDAPISRGEECRLAFVLAKVDFEDNRLTRDSWLALKPSTPYGSLPLLDIAGKPTLAQSNAILAFIGRQWGLHPKDLHEAARHESVLAHAEDFRAAMSPSLRMTDEAQKKAARETIVATYLPRWAESLEKQIADDGPFFAGAQPHVVDVKLHMMVRWFNTGKVDHIPADVFAPYKKLIRVHDAVRDHELVKAWYSRS